MRTPYHQRGAIEWRERGEALAEISHSYKISHSTISRFSSAEVSHA